MKVLGFEPGQSGSRVLAFNHRGMPQTTLTVTRGGGEGPGHLNFQRSLWGQELGCAILIDDALVNFGSVAPS